MKTITALLVILIMVMASDGYAREKVRIRSP